MHSYFHARSSARKLGGEAEDYLAVHDWFEQAREKGTDTHRGALLLSCLGIMLCEKVFGSEITRKSDGVTVPTRLIAVQHILEELGRVPTVREILGDSPSKDCVSLAGTYLDCLEIAELACAA